MLAIAIVAVLLGVLRERNLRFERTAFYHFPKSGGSGVSGVGCAWMLDRAGNKVPSGESERFGREMGWHRELYDKYRYAASHPWLPVLHDPAPDH